MQVWPQAVPVSGQSRSELDLAYRKLAVQVLAQAVKDASRGTAAVSGRTDHRPQTARRFLSDVTNPRLTLWCAWLDLDPTAVCAAAADVTWVQMARGRIWESRIRRGGGPRRLGSRGREGAITNGEGARCATR